ncbi:MAG: CsgE family curli-type amyloid fiber assembly protein [Arenibacter sp.]|uniref:CsgE family curli-type amyloid fiber assembly protein n=1 Tax=Arenibacter amylolyticus TaxID=1406873 RepID=UPI000A38B4FE|nr:CsgE family curli-type amyloid fiber assembly protein [Arenibacter amylolyticus]MDX1327263.1 CsgE family curli-type amyloid fiber assembly protein [Arenibacter sp.]
MMLRTILLIGHFFLFSLSLFGQEEITHPVEANIKVASNETVYKITATALNKTKINKSLSYKLSVFKKATGNQSEATMNSAGRFVLAPEEQKVLSVQSLNTEENQRVIILLLIYENEQLLTKDRVVINGLEGEDTLSPLVVSDLQKALQEEEEETDGVFLKGLVVEDTKTKAGSDFYNYFSTAYRANNINGEEIVKIQEELALGSNTRLKIYVGQDVVAQFFLNPRASYLKEKAEQSVYLVNRHLMGLKQAKQQRIKY